MYNPETYAPLGNKEWTIQKHMHHRAINNGQSRDIYTIGQYRMDNPETYVPLGNKEWTIQRLMHHRAIDNGQSRDICTIGQYTERRQTASPIKG